MNLIIIGFPFILNFLSHTLHCLRFEDNQTFRQWPQSEKHVKSHHPEATQCERLSLAAPHISPT